MATVTVNNITMDLQNCSVELVTTQGSIGLVGMLEELSYSTKINREPMYGSHRTVQDWTDGEAEHETAMTVQKAQWDYWAAIAAELGFGVGTMVLTIGATYFKNNIITQDTIWRARVSSVEQSYKRGPDMLVVPVEFNTSNIYYQGVDVYGQDVGSAV
jgi:hypothetical protein